MKNSKQHTLFIEQLRETMSFDVKLNFKKLTV